MNSLRIEKSAEVGERSPKKRVKKEPIIYNGIKCDSDEEMHFLMWAFELQKAGYIEAIERAEPITLFDGLYEKVTVTKQLKTKVSEKSVVKVILAPTVYTPDFEIRWAKAPVFFRERLGSRLGASSTIEVKPDFDKNNMTRLAVDKCKWLYQRYSHFVNIVKLPSFFKDTFTPVEYLLTNKTKQARKVKWEVRTCEEFLSSLKKNNIS